MNLRIQSSTNIMTILLFVFLTSLVLFDEQVMKFYWKIIIGENNKKHKTKKKLLKNNTKKKNYCKTFGE